MVPGDHDQNMTAQPLVHRVKLVTDSAFHVCGAYMAGSAHLLTRTDSDDPVGAKEGASQTWWQQGGELWAHQQLAG